MPGSFIFIATTELKPGGLFVAMVALAYATPVAVWTARLLPWPVLAPLLTGPLAIQSVAQARDALMTTRRCARSPH